MDKRRVARTLMYGINSERAGATLKHTEYSKDGSGDHGTTFKYADGCITVYQHKDGIVSGYHADARGNQVGSRFNHREGQQGTNHPHHPEGQRAAVKQGRGTDWIGGLALSWDRALRWNGLRK